MAAPAAASVPGTQDSILRALHLICFALCVANVAWIFAMYAGGAFLYDSLGRPNPTDFVNVWVAGRFALEGNPVAAYDWAVHKQAEIAAVGFDFGGFYGWHYPPTFLFVAAALAVFPYLTAWLVWLAVTLPIYLATIRWIVGQPIGWLIGAGFPAVLANFVVGQNGFLTASLIGGTLGFMEKRPVLSGVCLGLLTYKPQFGVLFPFVLIAARKWTVFWTAALTAIALAVAAWLAFGTDSWLAFFQWLPVTSDTFLSEGRADIAKQQSLFALVRVLGGPEWLAWTSQAMLAVVTAAALCVLWRRPIPFELKAAALAAGTLLATPYVYLYDIVVLAVAVAFFLRLCLAEGFRGYELAGLAAVVALIMGFTFARVPFAFGATLIVVVLVLLRAVPALTREGAGVSRGVRAAPQA